MTINIYFFIFPKALFERFSQRKYAEMIVKKREKRFDGR